MKRKDTSPPAFRHVYETVFPLIVRVVYKITGDMDSAEELCQEAFIRYYERRNKIPDANQAKYWLIRVAKNLALNYQKRKTREYRAYERSYFEPRHVDDSAEVGMMKEQSHEAVRDALNELPENLKVVLVLKEYGELSYREISSILGISEGNVKVRAYRAREKLAQNLKDGDVYVP